MCDHDIAINFGAVAGEVILVDSCVCTVISICCDYYYFFLKKKNRIFFLRRYCSLTAAVLFKIDCLVVLGVDLLYSEVKRLSEQD